MKNCLKTLGSRKRSRPNMLLRRKLQREIDARVLRHKVVAEFATDLRAARVSKRLGGWKNPGKWRCRAAGSLPHGRGSERPLYRTANCFACAAMSTSTIVFHACSRPEKISPGLPSATGCPLNRVTGSRQFAVL